MTPAYCSSVSIVIQHGIGHRHSLFNFSGIPPSHLVAKLFKGWQHCDGSNALMHTPKRSSFSCDHERTAKQQQCMCLPMHLMTGRLYLNINVSILTFVLANATMHLKDMLSYFNTNILTLPFVLANAPHAPHDHAFVFKQYGQCPSFKIPFLPIRPICCPGRHLWYVCCMQSALWVNEHTSLDFA
eukprot:255675-Pelagomonas_calceolata.AAC.6